MPLSDLRTAVATPYLFRSQFVHDHLGRCIHRLGTRADMPVVCEQHDLRARCHVGALVHEYRAREAPRPGFPAISSAETRLKG